MREKGWRGEGQGGRKAGGCWWRRRRHLEKEKEEGE